MTAAEQLEQIAQYEGITLHALAKKIGVNHENLYDIRRGKVQKFSPRLRSMILRAYPNIAQEWLRTGKGKMIQQTQEQEQETNEQAVTLREENMQLKNQIKQLLKIIDNLTTK